VKVHGADKERKAQISVLDAEHRFTPKIAMVTRILRSQELALEHTIGLSPGLLEVPTSTIDAILEVIVKNPEVVLGKLDEQSHRGTGNPLFYSIVAKNLVSKSARNTSLGSRSSTGRNESLGELFESRVDSSKLALPDITYVVRGYGDFAIVPSQHFRSSSLGLQLLQLPGKARSFALWLVGQKNWAIKTSTECYANLGKKQAAFLFSLMPSDLVELSRSNLSEALGLPHHASTYYRLLRNRTVAIDSHNGMITLPVRYLLPRREEVIAYGLLPQLNEVLKEEAITKEALSDQMISKIVRRISRRTIAKYRDLASMPTSSVRQRAYGSGKKEPFRFSAAIEAYLPEGD
jgi:hypothetical protein